MNKTISTFLTASAIALTSGTAFAEFTGPGATPAAKDVVTIMSEPVDDMRVTLTGNLVEQIDNETYLFNDGTESIRVEIDSEDFPAVKIDEKTQVRIQGEVEAGTFENTEIEVDQISII